VAFSPYFSLLGENSEFSGLAPYYYYYYYYYYCTSRYTEGLSKITTHGAIVAIAVAVVVSAVVTEAAVEARCLVRSGQHTERHGKKYLLTNHVFLQYIVGQWLKAAPSHQCFRRLRLC